MEQVREDKEEAPAKARGVAKETRPVRKPVNRVAVKARENATVAARAGENAGAIREKRNDQHPCQALIPDPWLAAGRKNRERDSGFGGFMPC